MSDQDEQNPKVRGDLDWTQLDLDPEEGFVLSRIDGHTNATSLAQVTGLPPEKISSILSKLDAQGALVASSAQPAPPSPPPSAVAASSTASASTASASTASASTASASTAAKKHDDDDNDAPPNDVDGSESPDSASERSADDDAIVDDEQDAKGDEEEDGDEEDEEAAELAESDYRRVYVDTYRELDSDERVRIAQTAKGASLCALCFDPDYRVVAAVLENGRVNQKHARLIAKHHRTATGLDGLGRVVVFLRDRTTQRFLVRNPQLSDALFRKMMGPKRMIEAFHMTTNREATEKVRRTARKVFRTKFQTATADERVQLLISCEARCLPPLLGLSFDGRTAALLCGRTIQSTLFIQNLARFPGTPPSVLAHMSKSPVVKRMPQLRVLIRQHPNCPATLKRTLK